MRRFTSKWTTWSDARAIGLKSPQALTSSVRPPESSAKSSMAEPRRLQCSQFRLAALDFLRSMCQFGVGPQERRHSSWSRAGAMAAEIFELMDRLPACRRWPFRACAAGFAGLLLHRAFRAGQSDRWGYRMQECFAVLQRLRPLSSLTAHDRPLVANGRTCASVTASVPAWPWEAPVQSSSERCPPPVWLPDFNGCPGADCAGRNDEPVYEQVVTRPPRDAMGWPWMTNGNPRSSSLRHRPSRASG